MEVLPRLLLVTVITILNGIPGWCHWWMQTIPYRPPFGPAFGPPFGAPFPPIHQGIFGPPMNVVKKIYNPFTNSFVVKPFMIGGTQFTPINHVQSFVQRPPILTASFMPSMHMKPLHPVGFRPEIDVDYDMNFRNMGYPRGPRFIPPTTVSRPLFTPVHRQPYLPQPSRTPTAFLSGRQPTGYRLPMPTSQVFVPTGRPPTAPPRQQTGSNPPLPSPLPQAQMRPSPQYPAGIPRTRPVPISTDRSMSMPTPFNGPAPIVPVATQPHYGGMVPLTGSKDDEKLVRFYGPFDNRDDLTQMQNPYISSKDDYYKNRFFGNGDKDDKNGITMTPAVASPTSDSGPGGATGLIYDTIGAMTGGSGASGGVPVAASAAMLGLALGDKVDDDKQKALVAAVAAAGATPGSRPIGNNNIITLGSIGTGSTSARGGGSIVAIKNAVNRISAIPFKDDKDIGLALPVGPGLGGANTMFTVRNDGFGMEDQKSLGGMSMSGDMGTSIGTAVQGSGKDPVASAALGNAIAQALVASMTGSTAQSAMNPLVTGSTPAAASVGASRGIADAILSNLSPNTMLDTANLGTSALGSSMAGMSLGGTGYNQGGGGLEVGTGTKFETGNLGASSMGLGMGSTFGFDGMDGLSGDMGMSTDMAGIMLGKKGFD